MLTGKYLVQGHQAAVLGSLHWKRHEGFDLDLELQGGNQGGLYSSASAHLQENNSLNARLNSPHCISSSSEYFYVFLPLLLTLVSVPFSFVFTAQCHYHSTPKYEKKECERQLGAVVRKSWITRSKEMTLGNVNVLPTVTYIDR